MPDTTEQKPLHERLATEEGRRAYADEYGEDTMRGTLKYVHDQLSEAVQSEGIPDARTPEPLQGIDPDMLKPRSDHSRAERAEFYQAARDAGQDPNAAWKALDE